jgi:Protein of unknown function (DUF2442)
MSNRSELTHVKAVEPLEGLWIRVTFTDGAVMDIGLEGVFGHNAGIFKRVVEDREFFEQVRVSEGPGVVEWPGELDLDADVMYGKFKPAYGPDYQRRIIKPAEPSVA